MKLMRTALPCLAGLMLIAIAPLQTQQLAIKKALTLEIAKKIAAAAEKTAVANNFHMFILIMDDGGNLMYLERMDDAQLGSFEVALEKARSAVYFKRPTKAFEQALHDQGYTPVLKVPGAMPVEGGIPLVVDGQLVGAIGVSGGNPQQDGIVSQAGADAFPGIIQSH
jgi:uncharacterized protein GlcG (DUF336 family)